MATAFNIAGVLSILMLMAVGSLSMTVDICASYKNLCDAMLSNIQCDKAKSTSSSCIGGDVTTYGATHACSCGNFDMSDRQGELLCDKILKGAPLANVTILAKSGAVDVCKTYKAACKLTLKAIGCPKKLRTIKSGCKHDSLATFNGVCTCGGAGGYDISGRVAENINDAQVATVVATRGCTGYPSCATNSTCPLVCA